MWYTTDKFEQYYAQFLTPKQIKELCLTPMVMETQQVEGANNLITETKEIDQTVKMSDEDIGIITLLPFSNLQSELLDHCHNPHKLS